MGIWLAKSPFSALGRVLFEQQAFGNGGTAAYRLSGRAKLALCCDEQFAIRARMLDRPKVQESRTYQNLIRGTEHRIKPGSIGIDVAGENDRHIRDRRPSDELLSLRRLNRVIEALQMSVYQPIWLAAQLDVNRNPSKRNLNQVLQSRATKVWLPNGRTLNSDTGFTSMAERYRYYPCKAFR